MPNDFPAHLSELLAYLGDGTPPEMFASLTASLPDGTEGSPSPWLLGSSEDSAHWAARHGLPYCFADFINSNGGAAYAAAYRRAFKPSAFLAEPYVMAAIWTIAAASADEARMLANPSKMMFAHLIQGRPIPVPSVARAAEWAAANPHAADFRRRRLVLGTPTEIRAELDLVAGAYGADELMLVNILPDHDARKRSYTLLAAEYGLAGIAQAA
jgi:luciferase family oxidoreductase group 1